MSAHLKTPFGLSMDKFTRQKVGDGQQLAGKSFPCSVAAVVSPGIVRVRFEVSSGWTLPEIEVPVRWSQFGRPPVHVGMKGVVQAADARLGGISGLGTGTSTLDMPGNLSALSFSPVGSTSWPDSVDPDAFDINGPNGAVIHDTGDNHILKVSATEIDIDQNIRVDGDKAAFFGTAPVTKPTITGNKSAITDANAKFVITQILNALSTLGLVTDNTT